jgi:hypothetical protein
MGVTKLDIVKIIYIIYDNSKGNLERMNEMEDKKMMCEFGDALRP